MPRDGSQTRTRILDAAEALVLERGYGGMSVERVIRQAGITKGAFFYHFKTKEALARTLLERFDAMDRAALEDNHQRAVRLGSDALQRLLVFVGLFEEAFAELEQPYPGCLYAAYIYEAKLFDADTQRTLGSSFLRWRGVLRGMLDDIVAERGGGEALDLEALADMFTVVLEGAFITAKAVDDASVIARQLGEYRKYVELLFAAGR
ncbi:MAG: TetR/AcrR family transcriptional regulator [Gammaproteobacteria bacterium]|jgi:TetR/AcrR family transcriptional repressor of nem operon|nr:TetR/AcrR family transcriptional regulator [Gammaproteobacteria bacterium]